MKDTQRFPKTLRDLPETCKELQHFKRQPETCKEFQHFQRHPEPCREFQHFQRHPETCGAAQVAKYSFGEMKFPRATWVAPGPTPFFLMQGARSYKFNNLNLFHMALLAHVVHSEHPLYSLFEKNCYWFSNLIFLAAKSIDKILGSRPGPREIPDEKPEEIEDKFFLPFYLYMPQVAGRWMGFKVSEVQEIVLNCVIRLFFTELGKYEEKVPLYFF